MQPSRVGGKACVLSVSAGKSTGMCSVANVSALETLAGGDGQRTLEGAQGCKEKSSASVREGHSSSWGLGGGGGGCCNFGLPSRVLVALPRGQVVALRMGRCGRERKLSGNQKAPCEGEDAGRAYFRGSSVDVQMERVSARSSRVYL